MSTPPGWNPPPPGWEQPPPQWQRLPEDTTWAVLAHLSFFAFALIAPLTIYLIKKDESPFTRHHAAEALNFHLTFLIAAIVSGILVLVLIGFVRRMVLCVGGAARATTAAPAPARREPYRYPM